LLVGFVPEDRLVFLNLLGSHIQNAEVRTVWQRAREALQQSLAHRARARASASAAKGR